MKKILIYQDYIHQVIFKIDDKGLILYEHQVWEPQTAKWKCRQEWLADDTEFTSWYFKKYVPNFLKKVGFFQEEKKKELVV